MKQAPWIGIPVAAFVLVSGTGDLLSRNEPDRMKRNASVQMASLEKSAALARPGNPAAELPKPIAEMDEEGIRDHIQKSKIQFSNDPELVADMMRQGTGCPATIPNKECNTQIVVYPEITSRHLKGEAKSASNGDPKAIGGSGRIIGMLTNLGPYTSAEFGLQKGESAYWVVESHSSGVVSEFWRLGKPTLLTQAMPFGYCHRNLPYHPVSYVSFGDLSCTRRRSRGPPPLWTTCQAGCCYSNIAGRALSLGRAHGKKGSKS